MTVNTDRFRTYVTQIGFALEALAKQQSKHVDFAVLVVGDGELPDSENPANQTDLINQVRHYPVTIEQDPTNSGIWIARAEIPADDGDFFIREAGVKVVNENGELYSYARQPGDYKPVLEEGSAKSYTIRLKFIPGNASVIEAKIDPSVQFATPTDLSNAIKEHEDKTDPHPQYATDVDLQAHLDADDPHQQYLKESEYNQDKSDRDSDLSKLPHYPEIMTANNQLDISLAGTNLTVADNQVIRLYGWKDFNTTDLQAKSFEVDLAKTYHLRFTEANGLELKDLSDLAYNPTSKAETDPSFDSTYDDVLLAKIEAGTLTPLINKPELNADMQMVGMSTNPVHPARIFTYNWARTPIQSEGLVIGINAHGMAAFEDWNFSSRENVTAFDVLLVNLNRYMVHHKYRANDSNPSWEGGQLGVRFRQEVKA